MALNPKRPYSGGALGASLDGGSAASRRGWRRPGKHLRKGVPTEHFQYSWSTHFSADRWVRSMRIASHPGQKGVSSVIAIRARTGRSTTWPGRPALSTISTASRTPWPCVRNSTRSFCASSSTISRWGVGARRRNFPLVFPRRSKRACSASFP